MTSKKEKEIYYASGKKPYSMKIAGHWVNYARLGPLSMPFAIAAAIKYYWYQNPRSEVDTKVQKIAKTNAAILEFFSDQNYVRGVGDLVRLSKGDVSASTRLITNIPTQLIPLSSLQRWVNSVVDPVYRKTDKGLSAESIVQNIRKSIAFGSKGLPAYTDLYGNESRRDYSLFNALSPVQVTPAKDESAYDRYIQKRKRRLIRDQRRKDARTGAFKGRPAEPAKSGFLKGGLK